MINEFDSIVTLAREFTVFSELRNTVNKLVDNKKLSSESDKVWQLILENTDRKFLPSGNTDLNRYIIDLFLNNDASGKNKVASLIEEYVQSLTDDDIENIFSKIQMNQSNALDLSIYLLDLDELTGYLKGTTNTWGGTKYKLSKLNEAYTKFNKEEA